MRELTLEDLTHLKLGCSLLGSGGGGDALYAFNMVKFQYEKYGPAQLITLDELKETDFIVPISFMGSPVISKERLVSGKELKCVLSTIETVLKQKPTVLMASEIGGANAFTPLLIASELGLPVLDADMIGRAFPELQMSSCFLKNLSPSPAVIGDCLGNSTTIHTNDAHRLEVIARHITVAMGSSSAISFYMMRKTDAQDGTIPYSFSKALELGQIFNQAIHQKQCPIEALIAHAQAKLIASGTITDIHQNIISGFSQGYIVITNADDKLKLHFQNEYLFASSAEKCLAATPDILVLLEEGSSQIVSSENLRFGLNVHLLSLPAPSVWTTPEGLELVGPSAFNYEIDYSYIKN